VSGSAQASRSLPDRAAAGGERRTRQPTQPPSMAGHTRSPSPPSRSPRSSRRHRPVPPSPNHPMVADPVAPPPPTAGHRSIHPPYPFQDLQNASQQRPRTTGQHCTLPCQRRQQLEQLEGSAPARAASARTALICLLVHGWLGAQRRARGSADPVPRI
jgi:hypothetical protein